MIDKTYNEKINLDTASAQKIDATNQKLVDYLNDSGEIVAAKQVEALRKNQIKKVPNEKEDTAVYDKLLITDKKILGVLEKIYRDMIDEQDTSIKRSSIVQRNSRTFVPTDKAIKEDVNDSSGFGGFGALGGLGLAKRGIPPKPTTKATSTKAKRPLKTSSNKKINPKAKTPKKAAGKMIGNLGKGALKGARFLGPVGAAIGVGMAAYDAYNGWNEAGEALGINEKDLSTTNKASSATGSMLSGLTFGLVDDVETSKGINNFFGGNSVIEKLEKDGIIDYDLIGKSEITNWEKLSKLSSSDIQKIIDINDWTDDDVAKLKALKSMMDTKISPSTNVETEGFKKVDYKMKTVPNNIAGQPASTSTNPSDFKTTDLFNLNGVPEENLDGLEPNVLANLKSMAAEYFDIYGEKIQINSAFRSFEEQQQMKDKYGSSAASPGYSMHNYGLAVDMQSTNATKAIQAGLFNKYGFTRPVSGETWHVEPQGIDRKGIRETGMKTGYTDAMKMAGNQMAPKKASEVASNSKEGKETEGPTTEKNVVTAEVNKDIREIAAGETSRNLSNLTSSYDRNNMPKQTQQAQNQFINSNINNTTSKVEGQDRILNIFS